MGWNWAPFLCHHLLQEVLEEQVFGAEGWVAFMRAPPSFLRSAVLHWTYMDDYGAGQLVEPERLEPLDEHDLLYELD